jgi:hypothetical protein
MEDLMSSHHISDYVTPDEQDLVNLRRQLPHALSMPPGVPRAWRADLVRLQGYAFPWGYLVEAPNGLTDPAAPRGAGTSWRLLPTLLWTEVRVRARETRFHWQTLLTHVNCEATAILATHVPEWLVCRITERYFLGEIVAVGDRDAKRARCWLAAWLVTKHIDAVLRGYRECLLESIATDCGFERDSTIEEVTE